MITTTERIKKWNYISSQVYQFLADMEEDDSKKLVLMDREKELLHMYNALNETDQQVIYGLVSCFYDKTKQSNPNPSITVVEKVESAKCDNFSNYNTSAKADTETYVMGWV